MIGIKYYRLCWAAFALAVLFSCGEKANPDAADANTVTLSADFEPLAKAGVDATTGVLTWKSGDQIAVRLDDGSYVPFTLVSGAGTASASFSGSVPAGRTVSGEARYPWVTVPQEMEYVSDDYAPALMSATLENNRLHFTHEGALMHFTIKNIPSSAVAFEFSCTGGVYGNDSFRITFTAGSTTQRCFMVPVKTGYLPSYTISLKDANGDVILSKTKTSATEVARCQLRALKPLEVVMTNTFRVVCYNICNGMERDFDNTMDNFVAWVNSVSPDVLVLCEAKAFNKSFSEQYSASYFASRMSTRAARWHHPYVQIVNKDDYPVVITSSRPMTLNQRFDGSEVYHGALYVSVGGFEIVGMHLRPDLSGNTAQAYSEEGDLRKAELEYILNNSLLSPSYASRQNWIVCGDLNAYALAERNVRSPFDGGGAYFYGDYNSETSHGYLVYPVVANHLTDVLYEKNDHAFQPTMYHGRSRIDYIFASDGVYERVKRAEVLRGGFPGDYRVKEDDTNPSDHFPILMDLADYAFKVLDGYTRLEDWGEDSLFNE